MRPFWQTNWFLWLAYTLAALAISVQKLAPGRDANGYTAYENYIIFKNSFTHLLAGLNPYTSFPAEQWDLFKYSPAFAVCMAPFAALPDWVGLPIWNLLNALPLLAAILAMPVLDERARQFFAWFVLPELVIALQNSQSNGLTAALILGAFVGLERSRTNRAAAFVAGASFIKIFGIFAALPGLLYPKTVGFWTKTAAWSLFFVLFPLVGLSPEHLKTVYVWWLEMLQSDHSASVGISFMGWMRSWFGLELPKTWVVLSGFALLVGSVLAAIRHKNTPQIRSFAWASVLIWVVIFNHKAESPTFIIALCGVALWFLNSEKTSWDKVLLWSAFAFASLSPTDVFPKILRDTFVAPYALKAVPCIIIWFLITYRLLAYRRLQPPTQYEDLGG